MNIILTQSFFASARKLLKHFPKAKPDIFDFINEIRADPTAGDPVPGYSRLVYKVQGALKSYKIGKQGGLRAYYYFHDDKLAIFFIYSKKDMADAPVKTIQDLVTLLLAEFPPPA